MRAVAINVGANTNEPGFRGPVFPDGSFEYIPIPESESTVETVPTYGDLAPHLQTPIPDEIAETGVHLDPEFPEYPCCERYSYGDEHGVKAGPLAELSAGEYVYFYATLSVAEPAEWLPPAWGAFLIGQFRLDRDPATPETREAVDAHFHNNAHYKRERFDARVLLAGDPEESRLYERAVPLSTPAGGTEASELVTEHSEDSGRGPWWRRPLRFDAAGAERLRTAVANHPAGE
jgi:hypothetical protein